MKIGIDIDGVVLDFERTIKTYAELYDLLELKKDGLINKEEFKVQDRYSWTKEEIEQFIQKYFVYATKQTSLIAGVKETIEYLRRAGHELIVITARGGLVAEMKDVAEEIFNRENLVFDKFYWKVEDKLDICLKEKIDIMIDDYDVTCKRISDNQIMTLYFRDKGMKKLEENKYLKEINNWGEIYRYIKNTSIII